MNLIFDGKATTLNDSKYILFEFPLNVEPLNIYDIIFDMLSYKKIPILAHPERYSFVQDEPNLIFELIRNGVMMQSNYGSILGRYGERAKKTLERLLENDMVHFLGSDVHRPGTIYPDIPDALSEIEFFCGEEKLKELTTINPGCILENKDIEIEQPKKIVYNLKDKMRFRLK